ncbi:thioesterase family protein [Phenylobacterium sp. LjRoot219]|uniref:acyl-CoA thioesterase domain-containing protein n=1 Tax=Phenylobacterium sp. LjRoot219 TaxID=3342283 RepID=UPI003ECD2C00
MKQAYFTRTDGGFLPTDLPRSPWNSGMLNGAAIGGLLAYVIEKAVAPTGASMAFARLDIDILGLIPMSEISGRTAIVREGPRMQIIGAELLVSGRVVARARALRLRVIETPVGAPDAAPPPFAQIPLHPHHDPAQRAGIQRRILRHPGETPGSGAMWTLFDCELVAGVNLSPFVRAAITGDFGSGAARLLPARDYSFANVDISLHFIRMPVSEWLFVDAVTESSGNGAGIVTSRFADEVGAFARGHQTLFLAPKAKTAAGDGRTLAEA